MCCLLLQVGFLPFDMRNVSFRISNQWPFDLISKTYVSYGNLNMYRLSNWWRNGSVNHPEYDTFHLMICAAQNNQGNGRTYLKAFKLFLKNVLKKTPMIIAMSKVLSTIPDVQFGEWICAELNVVIIRHAPRKHLKCYKIWHSKSKQKYLVENYTAILPLLSSQQLDSLLGQFPDADQSVKDAVTYISNQKILTFDLMGLSLVVFKDPITHKVLKLKKWAKLAPEFSAIIPFGCGYTAPGGRHDRVDEYYYDNFYPLSSALNKKQSNEVLWLWSKEEVMNYVYSHGQLVTELRSALSSNQFGKPRHHNFKELWKNIAAEYKEIEDNEQVLFHYLRSSEFKILPMFSTNDFCIICVPLSVRTASADHRQSNEAHFGCHRGHRKWCGSFRPK